ncbi:MAG TPA: hypothetical protein VMR45_05350 [Patescibacteria group bacterium]|nr:hypothetical protein [Patescibacteria group bacterium]
MQKITSLEDAPLIIEAAWSTKERLRRVDLSFMYEFMDALGNPQDKLKVIHVAGTSGKTSTAYYAAALLQTAGKKVGLMISPHVHALNERVQINLVPMEEAAFCTALNEFADVVEQTGLEPNYFDFLIAFGFWELARQNVDYAVVEVGIGGLLDATNVTSRQDKVCVITDIGYDHVTILGRTLPEIARQKAGIIGLHNAVFCWEQADEIINQLRMAARQKQGDLHILNKPELAGGFDFLPLFQRRNFELALNAVEYVIKRDGGKLPREDKLKAAKLHIPGRMDTYHLKGKTIILDGSHNIQKMHALAESIMDKYPGQKVAASVGLSRANVANNRRSNVMAEVAAFADYIIATDFVTERSSTTELSIPADEIARSCQESGSQCQIVSGPEKAFRELLQRPESILVVVGSFFLLNHIYPLLGVKSGE